jgi:hypothetical protein
MNRMFLLLYLYFYTFISDRSLCTASLSAVFKGHKWSKTLMERSGNVFRQLVYFFVLSNNNMKFYLMDLLTTNFNLLIYTVACINKFSIMLNWMYSNIIENIFVKIEWFAKRIFFFFDFFKYMMQFFLFLSYKINFNKTKK